MSFLLTVAWRNLWRHKRRSLITATAMAVGVALCMATLAFNDGMFEAIFDVMIEQQLGHVQVHHPDYPKKRVMNDTLPAEILTRIDGEPGTVAAAPRLQGFALLGSETKSSGALLLGVDPEREPKVTPIGKRVVEGTFLPPGETGGIVLGLRLADELGVGLGDSVVAVTQASDGSLGNALYTVSGLVKTGSAQIDRSGAFVSVADLQDLLVLPDQLHNITILTDDATDIAPYAERLRADIASDTVEVQTWWEASPQSAQMMSMRDFSSVIVLGIVFGAAGLGILNTMMMSVFERTRELGVLKALGLRPTRMVGLILVESVLLASLAVSIGLALGGGLDAFLVLRGIDLSASAKEGISFSGVVLDPVIKGVVRWEGVAQVVGAVFFVSLASSLWPAIRAARLDPVESLRAE